MQLILTRCLLGGTVAGAIAAVVNAVIYATGVIDPTFETPAGGPIPLGAVVVFSLVPNIIGGGVFWALRRHTTPVRLWRIVVAIVTVVSFVTPFSLQDPPAAMLIGLLAMHVIAGLAAMFVTPEVAMRSSTSSTIISPDG